jgi:hypothetical protein
MEALDLQMVAEANGQPPVARGGKLITPPICAKALLESLRESVDRHAQTFGTVAQEESE